MERRRKRTRLALFAARSLATTCRSSARLRSLIPALQQAGHHAHGPHHLGVAQAHVGEGVVARRRGTRLRHRALHAPLAEDGQGNEHDRRRQRKRAEQRMQEENDEDIDRRPGQIEDGMDARPGDELPEGVEIAQGLARRRRALGGRFHGRREHAPGHLPVEAHARPREHARAHEVEAGERDEREEQHDGQHHQRDVARARDHPVVDLQHIERCCEIEQVDAEAEDQRGEEIAPAAMEHAAQLIGLRFCKHANYDGCCGGLSTWRTLPAFVRRCTTAVI